MSRPGPIRDCPHGRQKGKCPECDVIELERELAERMKFDRLTADEVSKIENRIWANTMDKGGTMALFIQRFAKAIQDAVIKKNGGDA